MASAQELIQSSNKVAQDAAKSIGGTYQPGTGFVPTAAPILDPSVLTNTAPLSIPPTKPTTLASGLSDFITGSVLNPYRTQRAEEIEQLKTNDVAGKRSLASLFEQIGEKGARREQLYGQEGVDTKRKSLDDITNQLEAEQASLIRRQSELEKNPQGLFGGALQDELARMTHESAQTQANLAIVQSAANRSYTTATSIADRKLEAEFEPLKDKLEALKFFYADNKETLTAKENQEYQDLIKREDREYNTKLEDAKTLKDTKLELLKLATTQDAPVDVLQGIQNAQTPEDAITAAGEYGADMLDRLYKDAQIRKINAEITPNEDGTMNVPGVGAVSAGSAALAQQYAATGKLPSKTDLEAAGATMGEVARIARMMPQQKGTIIDVNTGVKPSTTSVSETLQGAYGSLYSVVELAKQLKELDQQRARGLVGGTLGKVFGSADQKRYMDLRGQIVDLLSRARSGAALTTTEEARYSGMIPGRFAEPLFLGADTQVSIQNFIDNLSSDLNNKLNTQGLVISGFSKKNVEGKDLIIGEKYTGPTGEFRIGSDGEVILLNQPEEPQDLSANRPTRNNNPLNIKSSAFTSKFSGVSGTDPVPAKDGGKFLTFNSPEDGFNAAKRLITSKGYANLSVDAALKRWSNKGYGGEIAPSLKGKKVNSLTKQELDSLIKVMARREGYTA